MPDESSRPSRDDHGDLHPDAASPATKGRIHTVSGAALDILARDSDRHPDLGRVVASGLRPDQLRAERASWFWVLVLPGFAAIAIWHTWKSVRADGKTNWPVLRKQIYHWIAFFISIKIMFVLIYTGNISGRGGGLVALLLMALTFTLVGVKFRLAFYFCGSLARNRRARGGLVSGVRLARAAGPGAGVRRSGALAVLYTAGESRIDKCQAMIHNPVSPLRRSVAGSGSPTSPWERLAVWAIFLLVLCLLRRMLLVLFLTFMVCYLRGRSSGSLLRSSGQSTNDAGWNECWLSVSSRCCSLLWRPFCTGSGRWL